MLNLKNGSSPVVNDPAGRFPGGESDHARIVRGLLLSLCVAIGGCSTAASERREAMRIEEGKAQRAELEAGCAAEGYTPGTPDFRSCVGRASIAYANSGISRGKVMHQGIKHGYNTVHVANAGLQLARVARVVSDARVKRDIEQVGMLESGIGLYRFRYVGGRQLFVGVMAQEVQAVAPSAVQAGPDGILRVDYGQLGTRMVTWEDWLGASAGSADMPARLAE